MAVWQDQRGYNSVRRLFIRTAAFLAYSSDRVSARYRPLINLNLLQIGALCCPLNRGAVKPPLVDSLNRGHLLLRGQHDMHGLNFSIQINLPTIKDTSKDNDRVHQCVRYWEVLLYSLLGGLFVLKSSIHACHVVFLSPLMETYCSSNGINDTEAMCIKQVMAQTKLKISV